MSNFKNLLSAFPLRPNEWFNATYPQVAANVTPLNTEDPRDFSTLRSAQETGRTFGEMDGVIPLTWGIGETMEFFTQAFTYGLGIIVRDPMLYAAPRHIMSHPNVLGAIVDRGGGSPAEHAEIRRLVNRDGLLPVWFVFDGTDGADACADQVRAGMFRGMSVYTVTRGRMQTVLTPVT